jgi:hypothetical protein
MIRLRTVVVVAAVLATAASGLSASPAMAADQVAACDPSAAAGLTWSTPSFLAWGRQDRIGANVVDPSDGPGYADDSASLKVDAGSASLAPDPMDHDLEFVLKAPEHGAALHADATWNQVDAEATVTCSQTAAMSVPLGFGKTLRFKPKLLKNGIAWVAAGAGDCHDIAVQTISVTVQQGAVKRQLNAADQCNPAGSRRVSTADWEIVLADGQFELHALKPRSSLKTRMRYAVRVGPRRVASGSLSLVRTYRPERLIVVSDQAFQSVCVHGRYQPKWYGSVVGCKIPGAFNVHVAPV